MEIDWALIADIAGPVLAMVVGAVLNRAIESRPRLIAYLGHRSEHRVQAQHGTYQEVYTHSVVIQNSGRKAAKNVRLAHAYLPDFNLMPYITHNIEDIPGGGKEIIVPTLVPGEQVTISYLYFPPLTWDQINGKIKSDEGLAKVLNVLPTPQYPKWVNLLALLLIIFGAIFIVYILFSIIQ